MTLRLENGAFLWDGKPIFLNAGEIQYFRLQRELWEPHLQAAADAGLMAVTSYIPWDWHEVEEGKFDFDGHTHPARDLAGWIDACAAHGLKAIVKPGPYILAEYRGAGIPDWFFEKFGREMLVLDSGGNPKASMNITYADPVYLDYAGKWYDRVLGVLAPRQAENGGPIILMQVCNEVGLFQWLNHQADYSPVCAERFHDWLATRYPDIGDLNRIWETSYSSFEEVVLPPDGAAADERPGDRARNHDWHAFWRNYLAVYLNLVVKMARERGMTVPFYHNLPGWIYGSAYEFPVNIVMYEECFRGRSDILFGVDHIPEFLSYRNMHDDRIINDIAQAVQGADAPLFAAEFQSGSREHHVVTNPTEMELFYKASLAHGLRGWNYYMFSQGRNRRGKGYSGDTFYWFNPVSAEGERGSTFPLVQRMSQMISAMEPAIVHSRRKAEVAVAFYAPYYASEVELPSREGVGLQHRPSAIRRPAYFDGLLRALQLLNVDYDLIDLGATPASEWKDYRQLWAFCCDEMEASAQRGLLDYAKSGGHLVVYPYLPDRDLHQQPCTLLRDALNLVPERMSSFDEPLIDILDFHDIKSANPHMVFSESSAQSYRVMARTLQGDLCGLECSHGDGKVSVLGTFLGYDTEAHLSVYEAILESCGARLRQAVSSTTRLSVRQRFGPDSGLLFLGNYFNEACQASATYTHPVTGETIALPYPGGTAHWPGLYGVLTPLAFKLSDRLTLLHTTSDVLGIETQGSHTRLRLHGHRDVPGELVWDHPFHGSITVNGKGVECQSDAKRSWIQYPHPHEESFECVIDLDSSLPPSPGTKR